MFRSVGLVLFALVQLAFVSAAHSQQVQIPARARLFGGATAISPTQLNTVMDSQGLKKFESLPYYGFEVTTPLLSWLEIGGRFFKRGYRADKVGSTLSTDNYAELSQESVQLLARLDLFTTDILRFDMVGGIGGSNTKFTLKGPTQAGEIEPKAQNGASHASLFTTLGASASIGYKWVYFTVEAGLENNKVDGFKQNGTISSSLQEFNLSGKYVLIGLLIDGLSGTKK